MANITPSSLSKHERALLLDSWDNNEPAKALAVLAGRADEEAFALRPRSVGSLLEDPLLRWLDPHPERKKPEFAMRSALACALAHGREEWISGLLALGARGSPKDPPALTLAVATRQIAWVSALAEAAGPIALLQEASPFGWHITAAPDKDSPCFFSPLALACAMGEQGDAALATHCLGLLSSSVLAQRLPASVAWRGVAEILSDLSARRASRYVFEFNFRNASPVFDASIAARHARAAMDMERALREALSFFEAADLAERAAPSGPGAAQSHFMAPLAAQAAMDPADPSGSDGELIRLRAEVESLTSQLAAERLARAEAELARLSAPPAMERRLPIPPLSLGARYALSESAK